MPVIFLTARGDETDKVSDLRFGVDDYLVKPWGVNELLARIEVRKRHMKISVSTSNILTFENLKLVFQNGVIKNNGTEISLNSKEHHILKILIGKCRY